MIFRTFIGGRAAYEDDMKILDPLKGESVVVDLEAYRRRRHFAIQDVEPGSDVIQQRRHTVPRLAEDDEPVPPFEDYEIVFEPDFSRNGEDDSA
jgi:hypothetical protein